MVALSPVLKFRQATSSLPAAERVLLSPEAIDEEATPMRAFVKSTFRSRPMQLFFGREPDDTCRLAVRFLADAMRSTVVVGFVAEAGRTEVKAAVRLLAVALEAEPICDYARSPRASRRRVAVRFVEDGLHVIQEDLRLNATPDAVSTTEAAPLLGVKSPNTVKSWIERGFFPRSFTTPGGHWRIPRDDVDAFARHRDAATSWTGDGTIRIPRGDPNTDL